MAVFSDKNMHVEVQYCTWMLTKKINNARVRYTITHYNATYSRYPTYMSGLGAASADVSQCDGMTL